MSGQDQATRVGPRRWRSSVWCIDQVVEGLSVPALRKSLEPTPCDRDWKQFRLIETLMSSVLGARLAIGKTSAPREFSFCQTRSVTQSFRWTVDRGGQQSLVSKVASQSAQVAEL